MLTLIGTYNLIVFILPGVIGWEHFNYAHLEYAFVYCIDDAIIANIN